MFRSVLAAALALVVGSCGRAERAPGPLVDDMGRPVSDAVPVRRAVSLAPSLTELLFAIGAGDRLVGRTRWCNYPPPAADVPSVGDGLNPNVELIVAQRPDWVFFYASPSNDPAIRQLTALGIATASWRTDRFTDLGRTAQALGRLTGERRTADSLSAWLDRELATLAATRRGGPAPAALVLAWDDPPIVIGGASFLSEMVELAGARNVFGDLDRPSAQVSIETIAERDPDVIVVASDSGPPDWAGRSEWSVVRAVAARRFVVIGGSEFSRPSFRGPAAVRRLRAALEAHAR